MVGTVLVVQLSQGFKDGYHSFIICLRLDCIKALVLFSGFLGFLSINEFINVLFQTQFSQ